MRCIFASFSLRDLETVCWTQTAPKGRLQTQHLNFAAAENPRPPFWCITWRWSHCVLVNSKHWFTTSFLQMPKSDARSVCSLVVSWVFLIRDGNPGRPPRLSHSSAPELLGSVDLLNNYIYRVCNMWDLGAFCTLVHSNSTRDLKITSPRHSIAVRPHQQNCGTTMTRRLRKQ